VTFTWIWMGRASKWSWIFTSTYWIGYWSLFW